MTTILLHGFWGQPQDWNDVLAKVSLGRSVLIPDLHEEGPLSPRQNFDTWAKNFHAWLAHEASEAPVEIVGYSMGARLALNAVIANPQRFKRALLLSGAPFIPREDFHARFVWEEQWKERFESQPWAELEAAWQDQSVFAGSETAPRRRSDPLREMLGLAMTNWSVTKHPFEQEHVRRLQPSVEWAFGALDQKYLEMAKTLASLPVQGQIHIIPNAGHRLIADAAPFVAGWIDRS